jgi:Ran GTPase-activating protein (RanGAP) involved in mRNA processing and transport
MMEEFKKMLLKKLEEQGGPKHDGHMKAKADMSKELSDTLGADIMKNLKPDGMKKVVVASNSEEGLKEGLEKAEDVIESKSHTLDKINGDEEESENEESEDESEGDSEDVDMRIAELEKQLQELKAKKA